MGLRTLTKNAVAASGPTEERAYTAPAPGGKKWVTKSSGASCLLRQPSGDVQNTQPDSSTSDGLQYRPQTTPAPTLTPQFHWNLNASALKSLNRTQVEQLYGLFKFYDSSTFGDTLPSINCNRLLEILRDARLLGDNHTNSAVRMGLSVESIERIFAQAVMGKMRVYLDADNQPALTFPLFCGALMNCAMLLAPTLHPEPALRLILPILLEGPAVGGHHHSSAKGLLKHLPSEGTISMWTPSSSGPFDDSQPDFRDLPPFQQVIADCTRDKALEELKQDKLARVYQIPPSLATTFHRQTLALVSTKFRLFDTFDRGMLPRHEVFPLLSSLGRHADLPDPYAVLATLSNTNDGDNSAGAELTLVQVLQAIETTRQATRSLVSARLAPMRIPLGRVEPIASVTTATASSTPKNGPTASSLDDRNENPSQGVAMTPNKVGTHTNGSNRNKERGKCSKPRRSITGTGGSSAAASSSSHAPLGSKHHNSSKMHLVHHVSGPGKKKSGHYRKQSSKVGRKTRKGSEMSVQQDKFMQSESSELHTQRSATTIGSFKDDDYTTTVVESLSSRSDIINSDRGAKSQPENQLVLEVDRDFELQSLSNTITVQMHDPPHTSNSKTIRIFLLLGGDHDGAICCSIALVFATREIVEVDGTYFSTAPSETTRITPVLPTQKNRINALLMLKKRVQLKRDCGFELRPADQLVVVDEMLLRLQKRQPHYCSPLKPSLTEGSDVKPAAFSATATSNVASSKTEAALSRIPLLQPQGLRHLVSPQRNQVNLPSNYKDLLAAWEVSQGDNCSWIHNVNAASPLKPASHQCTEFRGTTSPPRPDRPDYHLTPLRLPTR